jgi:hypothetical protein
MWSRRRYNRKILVLLATIHRGKLDSAAENLQATFTEWQALQTERAQTQSTRRRSKYSRANDF